MKKASVDSIGRVVLAMALCSTTAGYADGQRRYRVVDLAAAVGAGASPVAIDDQGVVAIRIWENGQVVSLLYDSTKGEVVKRFPAPDGYISGLSSRGNAAGTGASDLGWFVVDGVRGTLPLAGGNANGALAVNDAGEVAGFVTTGSRFRSFSHAIVYSPKSGKLTDLGTLGGDSSIAFAINDDGQVAGWAHAQGPSGWQEQHAFRFDRGRMEDLGSMGGTSSFGLAIDQNGRVAGFYENVNLPLWPRHAFLFDGERTLDLGTLPGRRSSEATAMNNEGEIVGDSYELGQNTAHAFIFSGDEMVDLNDLAPSRDGFVLQTATGINDDGLIVGMSARAPSPGLLEFRAYLLVPEDD